MRQRYGVWIGLGAVLLAVALLAGSPPDEGEPLDPDSTGDLGTRGLVLTLEALGAEVHEEAELPGTDEVVLLLQDRLDDDARADLEDWVDEGGTLVVADPSSSFTPEVAGTTGALPGLVEGTIGRDRCDVDALDDVNRVDPGTGTLYVVPSGAESCFGDGEAAFVVVGEFGQGTVAAIGGASVFVNDSLDIEDNAALDAALLAPQSGTQVTMLAPPAPGAGDETLADLIAPGVKAALLQLAIAFLVYALWRARRLGRPIAEPQPVQIAGSELVEAVGGLLQQGRDPEQAAATLRQDLRRALEERLGLPRGCPPEVVADTVAVRTALDRRQVFLAVGGPPVTDERQLVELAREVEAVREEVLDAARR